MNELNLSDLPRRSRQRPRPETVDTEMADRLSHVTTTKLHRSAKTTSWVSSTAMWGTPVCVLAGVWVNRRWLPTALVSGVVWLLATKVSSIIRAEVARREDAELDAAAEVLRGCFPENDNLDVVDITVPADALRTLLREGRTL